MSGSTATLTRRFGRRWTGSIAALATVVVCAMLAWSVPAGASTTTNPYSSGATGYDVSYPNCGATPPGGFAIVGLGGGRPFTTNSCLNAEWSTANGFNGTPAPALYFNTGYAGAYLHDITSGCQTYDGPALNGLSRHEQRTYTQAWEIGCSEVDYAVGVASAQAGTPSMWWADIEIGNSWSTNQYVNQYAVDGISYEMQQFGGGGVYSNAASWNRIVGSGFQATPPISGDWGPGLTCGAPGFDRSPVWVVQGGTVNGVDTDIGCG